MTRKGQAPSEGCEQPLSFVMPGPCGPSPRGSAVRQMGCWQIDPCSYGSCQSAVRKTPQNILLSQLRAEKKNIPQKNKHLSLLGLWMFKCLYFSGTREVMDRLPPFVISGSVSNSPSLSLKCQKSSASFPPGPLSSCLIERLWDEDGDQRGNLSPTSFWLTGLSSEAQPIGLALIMTWDDGMLIRSDQALNSLSDAPGSLRGHR